MLHSLHAYIEMLNVVFLYLIEATNDDQSASGEVEKRNVQIKNLEKARKLLKQERDDMQKVIRTLYFPKTTVIIAKCHESCCNIVISIIQELQDTQDKLKLQAKELREAQSQRKMAMDEFTSINEK